MVEYQIKNVFMKIRLNHLIFDMLLVTFTKLGFMSYNHSPTKHRPEKNKFNLIIY